MAPVNYLSKYFTGSGRVQPNYAFGASLRNTKDGTRWSRPEVPRSTVKRRLNKSLILCLLLFGLTSRRVRDKQQQQKERQKKKTSVDTACRVHMLDMPQKKKRKEKTAIQKGEQCGSQCPLISTCMGESMTMGIQSLPILVRGHHRFSQASNMARREIPSSGLDGGPTVLYGVQEVSPGRSTCPLLHIPPIPPIPKINESAGVTESAKLELVGLGADKATAGPTQPASPLSSRLPPLASFTCGRGNSLAGLIPRQTRAMETKSSPIIGPPPRHSARRTPHSRLPTPDSAPR